MDRKSPLSESNILTLCLGYTKFRYGIIQIGTISIEAPNRNLQLDIYIKSLSNGYQSQLIIKISIQDLIYQKYYIYIYISSFGFLCFSKPCILHSSTQCIYIYTNEWMTTCKKNGRPLARGMTAIISHAKKKHNHFIPLFF